MPQQAMSIRSRAERTVDRSRDLFARPGTDGAAEGGLPAFGSHRRLLYSEVGEHRRLIDVAGDLLGTALSGDVLSARQRRAPALSGEAQQIVGDQRNGSARTFLPRCVGGRADDHLTNGSPPRMVRVTAGDEKPCQRFGQADRSWFCAVPIEVAQCSAHAATLIHRPDELKRSPSGLAGFIVDP